MKRKKGTKNKGEKWRDRGRERERERERWKEREKLIIKLM